VVIRARVRGIYSTALSKILSENGIELVDVSDIIAERLGIPQRRGYPADVTVKSDEGDPSEILVLGFPREVEEIVEIIRNEVPATMLYTSRLGLYSALKVRVLGRRGRECVAETPVGTATLVDLPECREGDEVPATVIKLALKPGERLVLSARVRVVGKYALLGRGSRVSFSSFIRNKERIAELLALFSEYLNKGYSVKWRSNADEAPLDSIKEEIPQLIELLEDVIRRLEQAQLFEVVYEGEKIALIRLTSISRRYLDDVRREVAPTTPYHHMLRAEANNSSGIVELLDIIASHTKPEDLEHWIREWLVDRILNSKEVRLEHVRMGQRPVVLGPGKAEEASVSDEGISVVIKRSIRSQGTYDGLGVPKEPGDTVITRVWEKRWYVIHEYYGKNEELKGIYVNINSPPEIMPNGTISYLDLGMDIVKRPGEPCEIIDVEEFREAYGPGGLSPDVASFLTEWLYKALDDVCADSVGKDNNLVNDTGSTTR
jgi:hypothetical protein